MPLIRDPRDQYELAERVAKIIGKSSAAQAALDLQNKRIAEGWYAPILHEGSTWFVPNMCERIDQ